MIDARQKKPIQTIEGHFREVRWARDLQSFLAVEYDPKEKVHFTRRYQLVGKQYEPDPASKVIIAHTGNISRGKSHLTMSTATQFHPWRMKVTSWLGDSSKFIVDRLWPEGTAVQLHDDQTGHLVHRLILPKSVRGSPFVHPDGQTVAMCDYQSISLWEFQSAARCIPSMASWLDCLSPVCSSGGWFDDSEVRDRLRVCRLFPQPLRDFQMRESFTHQHKLTATTIYYGDDGRNTR